MVDHAHMLFSLLILLNVIFFFLGYIVGKLQSKNMVLYEDTPQMNKKSHHKKQPTSEISIDETKFVTTINTSGMEKKFDSLGDKKQTTENISDNINKLKNIKK